MYKKVSILDGREITALSWLVVAIITVVHFVEIIAQMKKSWLAEYK